MKVIKINLQVVISESYTWACFYGLITFRRGEVKHLNKKILITVFSLFCALPHLSAQVNLLCDMGKISVTGVFNENGGNLCPSLNIPELYVQESNTGLYASFCPFEIQFKYHPQDYEYNGYNQNWMVSESTFVNGNIGWMKKIGKYFLLETYVRVNSVSIMDIERVSLKPAVEFSLLSNPSIMDLLVNSNKEIFLSKMISLQAGASFVNKNNFKPEYFITCSFDFILFAELIGLTCHM